jgi:hypothetical protein
MGWSWLLRLLQESEGNMAQRKVQREVEGLQSKFERTICIKLKENYETEKWVLLGHTFAQIL